MTSLGDRHPHRFAPMLGLAGRLRRVTYLRYVAVSAIALGVDMSGFALLLALAVPATEASAIGYCGGILAHWLLTSRKVFGDTTAPRGPARNRQKAMFVVSALMGLGLTVLIVSMGARAGLHPIIAKGIAVVVSFQLTYILRKSVIFSR